MDNTDIVFGSVTEKGKSNMEKTKTLILEGDVVFSNVDVIWIATSF